MGMITLVFLFVSETIFLIWSLKTKNNHSKEKGIIWISLLALFLLFVVIGIYEWSFRYVTLFLVLVIYGLVGAVTLIRNKEKEYRPGKSIGRFAWNCIILSMALFLAILFPQYEQPKTTGSFEVATAKYTWTDNNRVEEFSDSGENRALTVEFWYPEQSDKTYPLVVFSHGAFGFSGSNYSTFMELASNGYVVASIGHTYHAFFTMDTSQRLTTVDPEFINQVNEINAIEDNSHEEEIFNTTSKWMKLRTDDENFIIDSILSQCKNNNNEAPFSVINTEKIGLMGHSLGGASSAQVGRERKDIQAVIVLDGTMLGEGVAFENNAVVLNPIPYPIPLLNIYGEDHYRISKEQAGDTYQNFYATQNGVCTYETMFNDAGHLNFTDLPLFSPLLAKTLGVGTVDERHCIETMNQVILEFFNSYLKDGGVPNIQKEY